jgi:hypothetical protein
MAKPRGMVGRLAGDPRRRNRTMTPSRAAKDHKGNNRWPRRLRPPGGESAQLAWASVTFEWRSLLASRAHRQGYD